MNHKGKKIADTAGFYLISVLMTIIVLIPFFWMLSTSLKSKGALMALPIQWIPEEPSVKAYRQVFERFPFIRAMFNSVGISVFYTGITILSASMAAFAFAKLAVPCKKVLFSLYIATMMIPTQVTLIPLFVIMNRLELVDTYGSVILPAVFRAFAVFLLVQNMKSIPNDFMEAAQMDGAKLGYIYWRIIMPLSTPAIASLSITTFMESWNDYLWPLIMLSDKKKMTLTLALNSLNGQYNTDYNVLMAGSLISMIPIVLVYTAASGKMKNGLMAGGIKQ